MLLTGGEVLNLDLCDRIFARDSGNCQLIQSREFTYPLVLLILLCGLVEKSASVFFQICLLAN